MNRRHFLRTSAVTALASTGVGHLLALEPDNIYRKNIGLQLYTLRNEIAKDADATIKAVVDAGYKQGEMYGFPDADPMIAAAKKHGLELHSSHFNWDTVVAPKDAAMSDFSKILDKAKEIGLSHLVIPYLTDEQRGSLDAYKKIAENANKAAAKAKAAGIQLAYHNHNFEFAPKEGGKCGYDIFTAEFSDDMQFEVDVFWIKLGGHDPVELIRKLKGRVSQLHLKDLKEGIKFPTYTTGVPAEAFQELGDGIIPMEPLIEVAAETGVKICHVEQDQSPDPLASIRQSMEYLRKL
jgi:sugar phosphate isomerase/epimerase